MPFIGQDSFLSALTACDPRENVYSLVSKLTSEFSYLKVWPFLPEESFLVPLTSCGHL